MIVSGYPSVQEPRALHTSVCQEPATKARAGPLLKNRYQLGRVLGRGGMCIVYQAWDTRLQRNVAIKRLEPPLNEDPRTRARFDREGRALAQLSHPNLVALHRSRVQRERRLPGVRVRRRTLPQGAHPRGPHGASRFGRIAGQVAEGLAAAHASRHRPPRRQAAEHPHRPARATPKSPTSASPPGPTGPG